MIAVTRSAEAVEGLTVTDVLGVDLFSLAC
jgi:hypothetical protein